jgi:hypothetical protein
MHVAALAGRRIDAEDATIARFPLAHIGLVTERLRVAFPDLGAQALVCSAACGADLLGLQVADELHLLARIILPFARERFRQTSVVDRPGDWGPLFDRLMDSAESHSAVRVLDPGTTPHEAYERVSTAILEEALAWARSTSSSDEINGASIPPMVTALVVWDGASRGPDDLTAQFAAQARDRHLPVREITT